MGFLMRRHINFALFIYHQTTIRCVSRIKLIYETKQSVNYVTSTCLQTASKLNIIFSILKESTVVSRWHYFLENNNNLSQYCGILTTLQSWLDAKLRLDGAGTTGRNANVLLLAYLKTK